MVDLLGLQRGIERMLSRPLQAPLESTEQCTLCRIPMLGSSLHDQLRLGPWTGMLLYYLLQAEYV